MSSSKKVNDSEDMPSFFDRLRKQSRISVYDLESFEEKRNFLLSVWNLIVVGLFGIIVIVGITWAIIAFTPLRQSIPGYPNTAEMEEQERIQIENEKMMDEILKKSEINQQYNQNLIQILNGIEPKDPSLTGDSLMPLDTADQNAIVFELSEKDSLLRLKVLEDEKFGFVIDEKNNGYSDNFSGVLFFTPVKGTIVKNFNAKSDLFGITVNCNKDEVIKCGLDGTVIATSKSMVEGNVIYVQHTHNLISVYKNTSKLFKQQGDLVNAGEPIAISGKSDNQSKSEVSIELWNNGVALDPVRFMSFE